MVKRPSRPQEESRGCPICDPAAAGGIGVGAAGSRPRRPRDRLLHISIADSEEGAPRAEPHRHLWPDRQVLEPPNGEVAKLADLQRKEELKRELGEGPVPLYHEFRELNLRKGNREKEKHVPAILEKKPFGERERL